MNNIAKKDVKDVNQLQRYLQESTMKTDRLYHYTSFESLVSIIKNKCFRLTRMDLLNDKAEQKLGNPDEHLKNYILSFTGGKEYVSMWAMYGKASGIKIRLDFSSDIFAKSINDNFYRDMKCADKIPLFSDKIPGYFSKKEFLISDVVYLDKGKGRYRHRENIFPNIAATDNINRELTGFVKYDAWEFEREIRLRALLYHDYNQNLQIDAAPQHIYAKINNAVIHDFHITYNPWLSGDMKEEIQISLNRLADFNLLYNDSQHDGEITNI